MSGSVFAVVHSGTSLSAAGSWRKQQGSLRSPSRRALHCTASAAQRSEASLNVPSGAKKVSLRTLSDCELAVSIYPRFSYNAAGYGGEGAAGDAAASSSTSGEGSSSRLPVSFPAGSLEIPALDYRSTKLFGIPLPPPLKIAIVAKTLEGYVDRETGEVALSFDAEFRFTVGPIYAAPPLSVVTTLTSESSSGQIYSANGTRLGSDGKCRLVAVARVPKTNDWFVDTFLLLPTDALAILSAEMHFSE